MFAERREALAVHGGLAWDLARMVLIARASLTANHFSLAETKEVLRDVGELARARFDSWAAFGEDCALGFEFHDLEGAGYDFGAFALWMATHARSPCRRTTFGGGA